MGASHPAVVARVVWLALVGSLVVVGLTGTEAWPLSSFRLFSDVRSGELTGWRLAAVTPDGHERDVDVRAARHELHLLDDLPVARRRARVRAWLRAAGLDPDRYRAARLYEVDLRLSGPDHRSVVVTGRHLELEVPLG